LRGIERLVVKAGGLALERDSSVLRHFGKLGTGDPSDEIGARELGLVVIMKFEGDLVSACFYIKQGPATWRDLCFYNALL